jgi:AraC-like DNA-binding protein
MAGRAATPRLVRAVFMAAGADRYHWRRRQDDVITPPALLQTPLAEAVNGLDDFSRLIDPQLRISQLDDLLQRHGESGRFSVLTASLFFGEVGLTSIAGSAMAISVDPLVPLCMVALPSAGWGEYRIEAERVECVHGQSLAFLPACGWRLTNDCSGGTGIHFREEALLSRLMAVSAQRWSAPFLARLRQPQAIASDAEPIRFALRQLEFAITMTASAVMASGGQPHPFLQLDDLILRSIGLLLFPELLAGDGPEDRRQRSPHLRLVVTELMQWMLANLHRPLSLSMIEARSSYSRRALQLGFKQEVGCGPMQWLRRQRLESAFEQLKRPGPDLTVTAVAQSCGYLSLPCFSRDFSARFRISPSVLLRQARRSQGPRAEDGAEASAGQARS